jgi:hypothetical protein
MPTKRSLRARFADFLRRRRRRRCPNDAWEIPPDEEDALVPVGPPRRPRPSSAVALELPLETEGVDAHGREVSAGDDEPEAAAA